MSALTAPLSQGAGYGVFVGLGVAVALGESFPLTRKYFQTAFNRDGARHSSLEKVVQRRQQDNRNVSYTTPRFRTITFLNTFVGVENLIVVIDRVFRALIN
jgi:hypothetical protein